jgi:hypothetical protein
MEVRVAHRSGFSWKQREFLALIFGTTALVACTDAPTTPDARPGTPEAPALRIDQGIRSNVEPVTASDELAGSLAGFGGAFVANGVLNVYLTSEANSDQGRAQARSAIKSLFAAGNRPEMPIQFLTANYSMRQLRSWEKALRQSYRHLRVNRAQVDERRNRFEISVDDQGAADELRSAAAVIGIPSEIVSIRVGDARVVPFTDLTNKVRPAGGGLFIISLFTYQGVSYTTGCTYGFNAKIDDGSGDRYMVTNAHCVEPPEVFGGLINAVVAQPDNLVTSKVGVVTSNPPSSRSAPGCAPGDSCRLSDAVLVKADNFRFPASAWDIGGINQTTARGVGPNSGGSTTINGRITIANASTIFFAGDTLDKVGSTTGWTAGVVTGTCVYHTDGVGGRICNGVVAAGANHGDSGSPVFWKDPQGSTHLIGILWGGPDASPGHNSSEFWFSRWDRIKQELSPFHDLLVTPGGGLDCNPPPGQICQQ